MNERISELAEQAGDSISEFHFGDYNIPNEFIEKFAELIVRDCRDMFVVNSPSWNLLNEKLEHFGVRE